MPRAYGLHRAGTRLVKSSYHHESTSLVRPNSLVILAGFRPTIEKIRMQFAHSLSE